MSKGGGVQDCGLTLKVVSTSRFSVKDLYEACIKWIKKMKDEYHANLFEKYISMEKLQYGNISDLSGKKM